LERATKRSLERGRGFIDAATELMEQSGSEDFTVQQVADTAGQSLRTLYQHFSSKDDLILAVFEEQAQHHVEYVSSEVDRYEDPLDRLAALIIAASRGSDGGRTSNRTIALAHYRMKLVVTHPDDLAVVQAPFVSLARSVLADAHHAGAIHIANVDHMTYVVATLKSAFLHSHVLGNELGIEMPSVTELAEFCLRGLGASLPDKFRSGTRTQNGRTKAAAPRS
jgi:AcrR family transcriptional regulator